LVPTKEPKKDMSIMGYVIKCFSYFQGLSLLLFPPPLSFNALPSLRFNGTVKKAKRAKERQRTPSQD